jgi:trimethylamine--corrinoid protein Co-methyltransferase
MRHFRDIWYSELFDRANYDEWFKKGARRFKERLSEQTRKLMDLNSQPLPTEIVKELDCMEKQWHRESGH